MIGTRPQTYQEELEMLANTVGLTAPNVVAYAEDPDTKLHDRFPWDDAEVAYQHRLWIARRLIQKVYVRTESSGSSPVRAFVSLENDREQGNGYRTIECVLSDEQLREQLLQDQARALRNAAKSYRDRFGALPEVRGILAGYETLAEEAEKLIE